MEQKNFLSSKEIVDSFLKYLDDTIYNYAYMIDGSWGSGKTYFVKEILIPAIEEHERMHKDRCPEYIEKKILYVSLYGIVNTEEVSRLLYLELHRINADNLKKDTNSEIVKKRNSKISSWLGTGAKIIADVVKDSKGIDLEKIFDKISSGFSLENCIFIFDDLERTSCNVNDILGYVNNFIEHDGIKVLLIANEKEINTVSQLDTNPNELLVCLQENLDFDFLEHEDKEQILSYNKVVGTKNKNTSKISLDRLRKRAEVLFIRNKAYKQIKEKVVGETIKYQPDYLLMIKSLVEKNVADNKELKDILMNKTERINEIALYYDHINLRTFLFFLSKMVTLYNCLSDHLETIEKMIEYVFLISIKFKMGLEIEEWKADSEFAIKTVYGLFDFRNQCLAFHFVDDFILQGKSNPEKIKETVEIYEKFEQGNAEKSNDPANKLQSWWNMEEKLVKKLMDEILMKMKEKEYSFEIYPQILNNFVSLTCIGIEDSYLETLMNIMKNNIRNSSETVVFRRGYSSFIGEKDSELYAIKIKEINEIVNRKNNIYQDEKIQDLLEDVNTWGERVMNYVDEHRNAVDNSFIYRSNPERILELINKSNSSNIEKFRHALSSLYSFSNIDEFYMEDYSNLKIIYDGLNPNDTEYDLIKKTNIKWLMTLIEEKMEKLKPVSVED